MCVLQLEDMDGTIGVTVFPKLYEQISSVLVEDTVVIVRGDIQVRNDEPGVLSTSIEAIKAVEEEMNRKRYQLWCTIQCTGEDELSISNDILKVQALHTCIRNHPGRDHYELLLTRDDWQARLTPADNTIGYNTELHALLEAILGKNTVEAHIIDI